MTKGALAPSEPVETDSVLVGLDEALQRTFGHRFDLWLGGQSWSRWTPSQPCTEQRYRSDDPAQLSEILQSALQTPDAPTIRAQSEGRYLIVVPLRPADDRPVVAVTELSLSPLELLGKLTQSFHREWHQSRGLEENREELECCVEQISEDFESLTYLLGLAEHLELCEVSRSAADVAEAVLPLLRELINAEALVFVSTATDSAPSARQAEQVGEPLVWIGGRIIDDQTCRDLVDRFKYGALDHAVVRNRLATEASAGTPPGLDCLLLTRVAKDDSCAGWLLALNRTADLNPVASQQDDPDARLGLFEFGTVEAGLMNAASMMLATHQRNVQLFHDKEALLIGVLRALINAIDAKDSYTCGHSDRVALIAKRIGQELGLDEERCEELFLAGLLHDIGKIGVPDRVLLKPGKLTDEEYEQIQQHPRRGRTILKHLDQLSCVLPGVLHHHERYDGKGYPVGLASEKIPIAARVIAVADAYDAMTSSRPYRKAMPDGKVEVVLREGAGTQWDGRIVDALLRMLPEIREICEASSGDVRDMLASMQESAGRR